MRRFLLLVVLASLVGCSRQVPEFAPSAAYEDLTPKARQAVSAVLNRYFGTPTEMQLWEQLPIHHSGAVGSVREVVAVDGVAIGVRVNLTDAVWPIQPGQNLAWLNLSEVRIGTGADARLPEVASFEEATGTITFKAPLAEVPEVGTRFAVEPGSILAKGRVLYAEHCQHCHGVGGDGLGPTAKYLNPRPRDFRKGIFKFTSTTSVPVLYPPSRDDLARTISEGIPGTYMPSFKLLRPEENDAIVEYVRWLAMRGQCEQMLVNEAADPSNLSDEPAMQLATLLQEEMDAVIARFWREADEESKLAMPETPQPPATKESIDKGRELYLSQGAQCRNCHGTYGLGDGFQTLQVEKDQTEPGLHDAWGNVIQPRNLRTGIYRGGRRPIDLYRRIVAGIKGTPMSGFKAALYDNEGGTKDQNVWHLVNYVMHMPYEKLETGSGIGADLTPAAAPRSNPDLSDTQPPVPTSPEATEPGEQTLKAADEAPQGANGTDTQAAPREESASGNNNTDETADEAADSPASDQ